MENKKSFMFMKGLFLFLTTVSLIGCINRGGGEGDNRPTPVGTYVLTLNTTNLSVEVYGIFPNNTFNSGEAVNILLKREEGLSSTIYKMPIKNEVSVSNVPEFNYSINNDTVKLSFEAPNHNVTITTGAYEPLYFQAIDNTPTTITYNIQGNLTATPDIETSSDCINWTDWTSGNKTLDSTNKLYVRNTKSSLNESSNYLYFAGTGNIKAGGNVNSMINYFSITQYCFAKLFSDFSQLKDISNLSLPVTTLANHCYANMFYRAGLTSIPENLLPATTLAQYCYMNMFLGCSSLTSLPKGLLPATTLAKSCYSSMFFQSGLISLPKGLLPATTLATDCYYYMFAKCGALVSLSKNLLPATTLVDNCYKYMFFMCSNLNIETNLDPDHKIFTCSLGGSSQCISMFESVKGGNVDVVDNTSYYWTDPE